MNNVFFTSDQHFDHDSIIRLMKRPFSSVSEMNEAIIQNHNSIVKRGDRVYHLGDFSWMYAPSFVRHLNGVHYLVKGNHDYRKADFTGFEWVKDVFNLKVGLDNFFLSHYAHRVWPKSHYGAYHLFGHSHGQLPGAGRSMDVGVDAHNFFPVSVEDIVAALKDKPYSFHHSESEKASESFAESLCSVKVIAKEQ